MMKRWITILTVSMVAVFSLGIAHAADPVPGWQPASDPSGPGVYGNLRMKLSGILFGAYGLDVGKANALAAPYSVVGNNRFDLTRAYVNLEPSWSDDFSGRVTTDLTRVSGTGGNIDGSLGLRIKYAYVNFNHPFEGAVIRAGVMQTPYIDFEEGIWKYRVLGQTGYELFRGASSSDLGVGLLGSNFGGIIDYSVAVLNGEGYAQPEKKGAFDDGKYKAVGGRLTVAPFAQSDLKVLAKLKLTGFYQYELTKGAQTSAGLKALASTRFMGLASYEHELGTVAVGYGAFGDDVGPAATSGTVSHLKSNLLTAFGFVNLPANLRLLGRIDRYDPDTAQKVEQAAAAGYRIRTMLGAAYRFTEGLQAIADWQHFGYESATAQAAATDVNNQLFLHLEAKF